MFSFHIDNRLFGFPLICLLVFFLSFIIKGLSVRMALFFIVWHSSVYDAGMLYMDWYGVVDTYHIHFHNASVIDVLESVECSR